MSDPYAEAIDALTEVATLCAEAKLVFASRVIAYRAHQLRNDGLEATADMLSELVEAATGDERAAFEMAYDSLQRIITRGIGAVT